MKKVTTNAPENRTLDEFVAFLSGVPEIGSRRVDAYTVGDLRAMLIDFWEKFDVALAAGAETFEYSGQPRDRLGRWASTGGGGGDYGESVSIPYGAGSGYANIEGGTIETLHQIEVGGSNTGRLAVTETGTANATILMFQNMTSVSVRPKSGAVVGSVRQNGRTFTLIDNNSEVAGQIEADSVAAYSDF